MQTYFPYSQIINDIRKGIKQTLGNTFFGEWSISGKDSEKSNNISSNLSISELYY